MNKSKKNEDKRFPGCPPSIGDIIGRSSQKGFLHFAGQSSRLFRLFDRVAGPQYRGRVSAYGYLLGTLYLRTSSPAYIQRFGYMKQEWIKGINIEMGMPILSDMKIKLLADSSPAEVVPDKSEFSDLLLQIKKNSEEKPE
jgi:hypothetical protein